MKSVISYPADPCHNSTYLRLLPWDEARFVIGRRYRVAVKGAAIHEAILKMAKKYKLENLPESFCQLALGKTRAQTVAHFRKDIQAKNLYIGVYLFTTDQDIPGNAGEQPGGATDSRNTNFDENVGDGVEGPSMLQYGGNPLPHHLRTATKAEAIKELAIYIASAYQHTLIMESDTDMREHTRHNQLIMRAVATLNPNVDAHHGFSIIGGINIVRSELKRKVEATAGKQAKLFS